MGVGSLLLASKDFVIKHRRTILTCIEIGSFAYGVYRAYKDGPKFKAMLEEIKDPEMPVKTKIKKFVVVSAPVIGAAVVNVTAAVCNQKIASKEIAQLGTELAGVTTALNLSQSLKTATEAKAREILGDEAVDKVHEAVMSDKAAENRKRHDIGSEGTVLVSKSNNYYETGNGKQLIYDEWSDTFFYSDINTIKVELIRMMSQTIKSSDGTASLSQYYDAISLPTDTGAPARKAHDYINPNDAIGWDMYGPDHIDSLDDIVEFYSGLDDGDRSFTGIHFVNEPRHLTGRIWR